MNKPEMGSGGVIFRSHMLPIFPTAGGFLLFWADGDPEKGVLHLDFKLSKDEEQIGLAQIVGGDTVILDSLSFGIQTPDTSYGRKQDGGSEWVFFSTSTPSETNANGAIVSIGFEHSPVVAEYRLSQNYPNPFNPVTTIQFSVKKAGKVTLEVFNSAGQKVATLLNKEMKVGKGKIVWDASKLASGLYFYQLISGDFKDVKKMLLIK